MTVARANRMRGTPAGNLEDTAGVAHGNNFATNCLLDSFYVTSASTSSAPPMICGVNTGFHSKLFVNVYVLVFRYMIIYYIFQVNH